MWSAKLTIYKIEWIPIKIMVSLGIKLEYFIFMSRLGGEYYYTTHLETLNLQLNKHEYTHRKHVTYSV